VKYPKQYNNNDKGPDGRPLFKNKRPKNILGQETGDAPTLYEFISKEYPYSEQNSRNGKIKYKTKDETRQMKGHTRTITDREKNIRGVVYHPKGNQLGFKRAEEIYKHPKQQARK
jgi:hypothetical protein